MKVEDWMDRNEILTSRSQDSGFSDSDVAVVPQVTNTNTKSIHFKGPCDTSNYTKDPLHDLLDELELASSVDDLSMFSEPAHASTPKAAKNNLSEANWKCPVTRWLHELDCWCDDECMTFLQNKPILESNQGILEVAANAIQSIHQQVTYLSNKLNSIFKQITDENASGLTKCIEKCIGLMSQVLYPHCDNELEELNSMKNALNCIQNDHLTEQTAEKLKIFIRNLAKEFSTKVDQILIKYVKVMMDILKGQIRCPKRMSCTLSAMMNLGLHPSHLADLLVTINAISKILNYCFLTECPAVHAQSLNMLATYCCTKESVYQFEKSHGVQLLTSILTDPEQTPEVYYSAIALLVQVTSPWIEGGYTIQNLPEFLTPLVSSVTRIMECTTDLNTLLLSSAALANMSWVESETVWPLANSNSIGLLLQIIRSLGPTASIYLKEQAATLLVHTSGHPDLLSHLRSRRAVPALICFIRSFVSPLSPQIEKKAARRVQLKSAIALSRLLTDPEASFQAAELGGIPLLLRLCQNHQERNSDDGILIACLVSLRKIAAYCGIKIMEKHNAKDLVECKIMDSYTLYKTPDSETDCYKTQIKYGTSDPEVNFDLRRMSYTRNGLYTRLYDDSELSEVNKTKFEMIV